MFASVLSAAICGLEVTGIRVEADVGDGLPQFSMVGYLSAQVKEAEDRVRAAFRNTGLTLPMKRTTINLSPADIPKSGSGFDLPIALSVLGAAGELPPESLQGVMALGELSLSGEILPVSGVLPVAMEAKREGIRELAVPRGNEAEARVVEGLSVIGLSSLREAVTYYREGKRPEGTQVSLSPMHLNTYDEDFADIHGQASAKRAAAIAVAGFHNLLLVGTPGSGKTMIARRIPTILPALTKEEALEISRIYSIAGLLDETHPVAVRRPFRHPHHTVSPQALAGGGRIPTPGEVSLAHRGVLFLDEMPEFASRTLEILRQPLEDREILISRTAGSYRFPASFLLLAAMNPCPCGYFPDMTRCTCSPKAVTDYQNRISRPLLDRIDLCVQCAPVSYADLVSAKGSGPSSAEIRQSVEAARERQERRFAGSRIRFNAEIPPGQIPTYCGMEAEAERLLARAYSTMTLSARSYYRVIRVARTIADLEASEEVRVRHVEEALTYRPLDDQFWKR